MLYYDCFSGISGDMNLAAMTELGVPADHLTKELQKLGLDGWEIVKKKAFQGEISGIRLDVMLKQKQHSHRKLSDINKMIDNSTLNPKIKETAKAIFLRLGEAEAKVHGVPVEKIHFHEVGAVDSIIDIVGAAVCYHYLEPSKVYASPVELGSGKVMTEHGLMPVPAPATAELLKGIPVKLGGQDFECTTPTGAAILACLVDEFTDRLEMEIIDSCHAIGHKKSKKPNFLRVFTGTKPGRSGSIQTAEDTSTETAIMLECNIDDMNPEWYETLMEKLFAAGAHDVWLSNIIMKKTRPAVKLSVLCSSDMQDEIKGIIFTNTTSLGIRSYPLEKTMLERRMENVETKYGSIAVKHSYYKGELLHTKPEYEDCKRIALEKNLSLKAIVNEVNAGLLDKGNK